MKTKVINIKLSDLVQFPGNSQEVPDDKMDAIIDNMKRRGWYGEPATIACFDKKKKISETGNYYIVSGNHRVKAAIQAEIKEHKCIAVVDKEYTWEQACKDNIMFNNLHGEPNEEKLGHFIQDIIENYNVDMDDIAVDTGLSEQELNTILNNNEEIINEKEIDENLETKHECPKCGYKWS